MITLLLSGFIAFADTETPDPILDAMVTELTRSFDALQEQDTPPLLDAVSDHRASV